MELSTTENKSFCIDLVILNKKNEKWTQSNCSCRLSKKIFTSSMIHLKRLMLTSLTAVSTIITHISNFNI